MLLYEDRDKIWQCKTKLKNSGIVVKEDFPMIIEQHRSKLYPVFRAAKKKNLKPLLIADSERKNSERKKILLKTWTLYHLICSLKICLCSRQVEVYLRQVEVFCST